MQVFVAYSLLLFILLVIYLQQTSSFRLMIIHSNHAFSRFGEISDYYTYCNSAKENHKCSGGFARMSTVLKQLRALEGKDFDKILYIYAGNLFIGTMWFNVHKSKICVDMMNAINPTVIGLADHEFDVGVNETAYYVNNVNAPVISANLDVSNEPTLKKIVSSVVMDVGSIKIGFVGHYTPGRYVGVPLPKTVVVKDRVSYVKAEVERLRRSVQILIVFGGGTFAQDKELAENIPEIDIIVGGQRDELFYNGPPPSVEPRTGHYPVVVRRGNKKIYILRTPGYTRYLGVCNFTYVPTRNLAALGQPIFLSERYVQDKSVLAILDKYKPAVKKEATRKIGTSEVILEAGRDCLSSECNFGNLITDAFVLYTAINFECHHWACYPIGFIDSGHLEGRIDKVTRGKTITVGDIYESMPINFEVIGCRIKGADLLATLETSVESDDFRDGRLLQVSGLILEFDMSKPKGNRLVRAEARCAHCDMPHYLPIVPRLNYHVTTVTYLTFGGNGFDRLKRACNSVFVFPLTEFEVVSWYIQRNSPVYAAKEERITIKNKQDKSCAYRIASRKLFTCMIVLTIYFL